MKAQGKMQKELKLDIADIVISVIFEDKNQRFEVDGPCKHFISEGKPEVSLYAHYDHIPKSRLGEKIFDAGTMWGFYRNNGKYILKTSSKAVILEPDFKSGDIYIGAKGTSPKIEYPLSYPLDQVLMINLLAKGRGVIVHACGIMDNGHGFLFAGTSRAGKSTTANLWKRKEGAVILSDDRIIIRKKKGKFWIYGTPWHGDAKVYSPEKAPLEKIFFLKHAKKNKVRKINPVEVASRLIVCSFPPFWNKKGMEFTLNFCAEVATKIPCYELGFVPDERILEFSSGL